MKIITTIGVFLLLAACINGSTIPSDDLVDTYSVSDFMKRLDDAIIPAAVAAKSNGLLLTEVKLTFNVVLTNKESGEIKILLVKVGGNNTTAQTTEYTVTLGSPANLADDAFGQVAAEDVYLRSFAEALEGLVADAAKYTVDDLVTHKVTASLKYFIQDSAAGEVGHEFEIVPVSLKAGYAVTGDATQTILLTFEAPKK